MTVVPMIKAPSKKEAQDIIRKLAAEGKVSFHPHAKLGKKKRKISTLQALNCLATGFVDEEPTQNLSHKGWSTAVVGRVAGVRLRVVVCLRWSQNLLVVTCYYE